jgi:hypothetical protein
MLARAARQALTPHAAITGREAGLRVLTASGRTSWQSWKIVERSVVKLPWSSACRDQDTDIRARMPALPASLRSVLDGIAQPAPDAPILMPGYPQPSPPNRRS